MTHIPENQNKAPIFKGNVTDQESYRKFLDRIFLVDRNLCHVKATWIGLPTSLGQPDSEPSEGPGYMRKLNAMTALKTTGANIEDAGDILPQTVPFVSIFHEKIYGILGKEIMEELDEDGGLVKNLKLLLNYSQKTKDAVSNILIDGRKVVAVGGDHSMAMGTIAAALDHFKGDLGVVWIDAHADINIPKYISLHKGSPSGNAHGMPVAHLMGLEGSNNKLTGLVDKENKLKPENLLYIGLKDLDEEEIAYLDGLGITYFSAENATTAQLIYICQAIDEINKRVGHMWVSTDLDGIDQSVAPGTRMKNKGGISYEMIMALAQYIGVTTNLVGMDIAEFAPKFDHADDKTAHIVLELIARFLGGSKKRFDETAYLSKPILAKSPKKKARQMKAAMLAAAATLMVGAGFNQDKIHHLFEEAADYLPYLSKTK